ASEFSLRYSPGNPDLRDKGRDLIQPFDVRQSYFTGLKLVVFTQLLFKLPDHAFVAAANRRAALARHLPAHFGECLPKAFYLSRCPFSLSIALNHYDFDLTT